MNTLPQPLVDLLTDPSVQTRIDQHGSPRIRRVGGTLTTAEQDLLRQHRDSALAWIKGQGQAQAHKHPEHLGEGKDHDSNPFERLVEFEPGRWTDPNEVETVRAIDRAARPETAPQAPPRPTGQPSLGWTKRGRMVQLPRTPDSESLDPVILVSHLSWPDWYAPIPSDRICKSPRSSATQAQDTLLRSKITS